MPNKKPLTNANGLIKEFSNGDSISVKFGGTGKSSLPKDNIIVGNTNDEVRTIKFNFDATNAPLLTDDVNSGYSVGSKWYDITNNIEYTCLDNTLNNAIWKSFNPSSTIDYVEFKQDANHQTTTGQISWNDTDKTFDLGLAGNSILQAGQEMMIYVHNETGSTIPNGRVVFITSPPTTDDMLHVAIASCDNDTAYSTIAVTTNEIPDGNMGYCTLVGRVRDLDTSSFSDGDKLFLSINGTITNTEVSFPNHSVEIGYCIKSDSTSGVIFVHIEKQFAIEDLYNVIISNPSQGDSFIYENNKWINKKSVVYHDTTLTGDGTLASPLSVVQSSTTSQYYRIHSAMMGSATGSLGFFSIHPQNINPFDNALTTAGDIFNNGKLNPIMMPFNWKLAELHVAVGRCAVAQSTTASTVTMRIEFFSHTGISRTSIGVVDVPLNGTNCGIYNNLGSNNFQTISVTNIINITGNANDMIGWQFTNRGASNDQINAVAQVTIESKFEQV